MVGGLASSLRSMRSFPTRQSSGSEFWMSYHSKLSLALFRSYTMLQPNLVSQQQQASL